MKKLLLLILVAIVGICHVLADPALQVEPDAVAEKFSLLQTFHLVAEDVNQITSEGLIPLLLVCELNAEGQVVNVNGKIETLSEFIEKRIEKNKINSDVSSKKPIHHLLCVLLSRGKDVPDEVFLRAEEVIQGVITDYTIKSFVLIPEEAGEKKSD